MKKIIEKIILSLFNVLSKKQSKDIELELQKQALQSTAKFIMENMINVASFNDKWELLKYSLDNSKKNELCLEFGVYKGDTINFIASHTNSKIYGFDSFNGLPENWRNGFDTGHFKLEKLPKVENNVELIVGLFEKSLPVFLKEFNKKISFIHIDCDLYSSTKTIFDLISNNVQKGTVIVFDEFFNYPGWEFGEALAFFEFIKKNNTKFVYLGYSKNDEQLAIKII